MAEKVPRRVRFIEVQPSKDKKGDLPPFKGKTDNLIMSEIHKNVAKNSKFLHQKPPTPKARKTVSENSFRDVKVTIPNHVENMFLAREAKDKVSNEAIALDQPKDKNGDDQPKDKKGDDHQPKDKKGDDQPKDKKGDDYQPKDKKGDDYQPKDKKGDDYQPKDKKGSDQPKVKKGDDPPKVKKTDDHQPKDKKGGDQPKDKKGDEQLKGKKDDEQLKGKKGGEDCVEGKKGKKKMKNRKRKKRRVLPLDDESGQAGDAPETGAGKSVKGKKKKEPTRPKPAKKTKESKKDIKEGSVENASSEKAQTMEEAVPSDSRRKLPCLFGFIATWIAKRKEKRREKKRKAIASRDSPQRLVEYEHRTARGGEAFTIELDNRPMTLKKPLLPPIKQTPGPILREKYHNADCRRYEKLAERKDAAREYERKKTRCKESKAETDRQFRHKTELAIRQKQVIAERNRELQSRCKSKLGTHSAGLSPTPLKEPSAESSLGSIYGPSLYSDNEVDRDDLSFDIPIF